MADFHDLLVDAGEAHIFLRVGGSGPPLLLLHGFPETHLMWREIAPLLAGSFTVVTPDLRGYGQSSCPQSGDTHAAYSKRQMAADMIAVMEQLGHRRFRLAGHDRGGRVAYRLALDAPDRVERLAVLDIVPGKEAWDRADASFALSFWPWTVLAQPAPLPERILETAADAVVDDAAGQWDSPSDAFPAAVREAYAAALRDPQHAHAICEEYRAAASIDRDHDAASFETGRMIRCPTLVLWAAHGALDKWYANDGGPVAIWSRWALEVAGEAVAGGHFFPEARPVETAQRLSAFFGGELAGDSQSLNSTSGRL